MKKAVILDISAIIYRTHYALISMSNSKGMFTGATYGFVNTLESILKEFKPNYLVASLDVKRSELNRTKELDTYKAHRKSMPNELVEQLDIIMEILDCYGIPKYKVEGYEADDVISTLATKFSEDNSEEIEVYVITGDKDLAQIVNEKINIALLGKKTENSLFKYIRNDEDVIEYLGVPANKIPDLFGLIGDTSDGIPGVSGIGDKTGVMLISKYGDLDGIYENIEEITGKRKEKLIEDKEKAYLSKKLATVHRNIEIEYDKEKLKVKEKDYKKLLPIYKKMEFKRFLTEIEKNVYENNLEKNDNSNKNKIKIEFEKLKPKILKWENSKNKIKDLKNEISIYENEFGIGFFDGKKSYIILDDTIEENSIFNISNEEKNMYKNEIYNILSDKKIIAYNIKDYIKNGIDIINYYDVMIAWYILGTETSQELEDIIYFELEKEILKYENLFKKRKKHEITEEEKIKFIYERVYCVYYLKKQLEYRLKSDDLINIFENLESNLIPVLANMELNGIRISREYFENYKIELENKIDTLENKIYFLAGEKFNISSPKQLSEILFEKMQIEPIKKTKTGFSTDVEVLEILANQDIEIAKKILSYRGYTKLLSTYVDPILKLADENSRIHTTFNQNGTSTGRLSSVNPNIQNIPVRTDDGIRIRKGFVSEKGWSLVSFDYSQIELRVLAELSEDKNLVSAYENDRDLHDLTARKIMEKSETEEISRDERSIAKIINFSILYGKTPFGLSKELGITMTEATQYIKAYFEQYPKVKIFLEEILEKARKNGFVETLYGTRRYIKGINSSNKNIQSQANRMAVNTVVQGTAANIIKKVMIKLYEKFKNNNDIKILLQVHDELIFEIKDEKVEKYMKEIKEIMENTVVFKNVKLRANGAFAKNWGLLK